MAWKIALWMGRILATIIISCLLSIWTTSYVVTSYIQVLLKQYEIPLEVEPVALGDVWGMLVGSKGSQEGNLIGAVQGQQEQLDDTEVSKHPDLFSNPNEDSGASSDSDSDRDHGTEGAPEEARGEATGEASDNALDEAATDEENDHAEESYDDGSHNDAFNQPAEEVLAPIEQGEAPAITPEVIHNSKESLSTQEKERVFELMMNKLPPESWQMFSSYVEDGLTEKELLDVQQMMAQYLSKDEYTELMELLALY